MSVTPAVTGAARYPCGGFPGIPGSFPRRSCGMSGRTGGDAVKADSGTDGTVAREDPGRGT